LHNCLFCYLTTQTIGLLTSMIILMTNLIKEVTEKLENSISEAARQGIIFLDYIKQAIVACAAH